MTDEQAVLTLAVVLSAAGAVVGAAFVTGFVQLLKSVLPLQGRERVVAFILSALLVALAYASVTIAATPSTEVTLVGAFGAFLAWYNIGRLSMAHYDDLTAKTNSLTGPRD